MRPLGDLVRIIERSRSSQREEEGGTTSSPKVDHRAAIERNLWIHESSKSDLYEHGMLRIFRRGEGSWLEDETGQRYLDLCSSMWQAPLGHGRDDIVEAFARQARAVASAGPIDFTTEGAAELAWRMAESTPGDLNRVFLTSSGSEATETAVKLVRQYHRLRGDHHRFKIISRYGSYHGAGMGGTSIGGRRRRDALYYPLLPGTVNVQPPTGVRDVDAAEAIRTAIEMEGPETVAAVIGEPVAITQFTIPDADYWPRVREICDAYGVLLIADETLTGCYRSGHAWAVQRWGVTPDVLVAAKAVSAGYAPVAAMIVRDPIFDAFDDRVPSPSVQSYGGHGASAAAGARAFEVYAEERMGEVAERRGAELQRRLEPFCAHPLVRDLRRVGLWMALELQDPRTGESLARGPYGRWAVGPLLSRLLLAHGLAAARMSEGLLHVAPAYTATDADFDFIVERVGAVLDAAGPEIERLLPPHQAT